jgi:RNA polymerase-binding transcription factor
MRIHEESAEGDVAMQVVDRASALARRIRAALDRMRDGSYGSCLQCEEEIDAKRLRAMPCAELCVRCEKANDDQKADSAAGHWSEAA